LWLSLIFSLTLTACTVPAAPDAPDVATWRAEKDRFMRESPDSPVPADARPAFPPLPYYPIDESYRVPASLTVARSDPDQTTGLQVLELPTSTGKRRKMRRIGTLNFTLKGQPLTLSAFVDASTNDMRRLFVPFGDLTNGSHTYPGGRYLDLDRTPTGIYDLDFNRAYHPFCVFNAAYDCPYPPKENRLKVPVLAGERLPASGSRLSPASGSRLSPASGFRLSASGSLWLPASGCRLSDAAMRDAGWIRKPEAGSRKPESSTSCDSRDRL
jgi:hypothetical protein